MLNEDPNNVGREPTVRCLLAKTGRTKEWWAKRSEATRDGKKDRQMSVGWQENKNPNRHLPVIFFLPSLVYALLIFFVFQEQPNVKVWKKSWLLLEDVSFTMFLGVFLH